MYEIVLKIHSIWAFLVVLGVLFSVVNAMRGFLTRAEYTSKDLRIHLFALIFTHIQWLLGIILYFVSPLFQLWGKGAKVVMKDAAIRRILVEHPVMMFLSAVLITVGWSLHKKQKTSRGAFGKIAFFYLLGLLGLLSMIPWQRWMESFL